MISSNSFGQLGIFATFAAFSFASYLVFFDYKRRGDPHFRRSIRKQRQLVASKHAKSSAHSSPTGDNSDPLVGAVPGLAAFLNQPAPATPDLKETYFMDALSKGETLCNLGPQFFDLAATCFYKALKVYPAPAELVQLFQKTVADPVFQLIMAKIADEVKARHELYFVEFPPADFNVRIRTEPDRSKASAEGQPIKHRVLIATRDFNKGDLIFSEHPLVSSILPQHLLNKTVCSFCLSELHRDSMVLSEKTNNAYCGNQCESESWEGYESLLYTEDDLSTTTTLFQFAESNAHVPLTIVRFLAQMVREDMNKAGGMDSFGAWDHLDRLKYLDLTATPEDLKYLATLHHVIGSKVPGLDEFLTEERYLMLKGKLLYNQMAIFNTNADTDGCPDLDTMRRCTNGTPSGVGVYTAASYLTHSCTPNTKASFPLRNNVLHLVANDTISKGDSLTIAFTDPSADGETRTKELAKWRFGCTCPPCEMLKLDVE